MIKALIYGFILDLRKKSSYNKDRDYDIYMVSKEKGSYFYTNVLDRALIEHKAKSVVYGKSKGPSYLFDEKSGRFRKRLKGDRVADTKLYIEKALNSRKKNTVSFLDFSNYEKFCNSILWNQVKLFTSKLRWKQ